MPLDTSMLTEYRDHVYSLAVRLMRNTEDAADVTQEVLIRLWKHQENVDASTRKAWTLRVTRNACLDALRRRKTRSKYTPAIGDHVPESTSPLPDADVSNADARTHIEHALSTLDEPYKSLIILREIHGLRYSELADALDLSLTNVKVYLHRARNRMRDVLETTLPIEDLHVRS